MSAERPLILFVGQPARSQSLKQAITPLGWHLYDPQDVLTALGMAVAYLPDIAVIDADAVPELAHEVHFHLSSIAVPIIVLSDDPVWSDRATHTLPADARESEVMTLIAALAGADHIVPDPFNPF